MLTADQSAPAFSALNLQIYKLVRFFIEPDIGPVFIKQ